MKGRWVSMRRSNLAMIIAAVKERVETERKKPMQRKA